jgi:ATP-dependent helicase/nuclease subunit B
MLKIIYGKSGSGKSLKLYNDIKENLSKEKIFLIVPEQSNLNAEQNLFKYLNVKVLLNVEVLTLSRMATRILSEVGGENELNLTTSGKSMIIYNILREEKNNLNFLGKSDKNIDIVSNMITEFKKHNITPKTLDNVDIKDNYTNLKLKDIKLIYEKYNEKITNSFIDENDSLTLVIDKISKSSLFENSQIYIDDFIGFTPQEYRIFEELLKKTENITVAISMDNLEKENKEQDIFYFNKVFANKLIEIAKNNKIKYNTINCPENYRLKNEELKFLENVLSTSKPVKPYEKECNNISLFLANNPYSELEYVANEILQLVKNKNYKYNEIVVISNSIENYNQEAKIIFEKYDIPIFIDEKKDLNQNILIKYVLALLEIFAKNWSFESVFNFIKLGMLRVSDEDLYIFENYCRKWGIRNYKWFKPFNYEVKNEVQDRMEILRCQIVSPLQKFKEEVSKERTAREITKFIYEFLIQNEINKILDEKIKNIKDIEISNEYNTSYKILINVLDEIARIFGDKKMSFETYKDLIQVGFSKSELGKIPATQDQVILGDSKRSRNSNIKVCFIIGINDGVFPVNNKFEGYLNDKDRELLKQSGVELAKTSLETLYESNFELYNVFCLASEKLYLSYCSSDKDGKSIRPSMLIKKVKRVLPKLDEKSDIITKDYYVTNKVATFDDSIIMYKRLLDGENISDEWKTVLNYYSQNEKDKFERILEGLEYTNKAENISKENIEKLYGKRLRASISRLEQYRRCPFSFHMKYGLKLKEKEELKLQSIDTGTFMHEVIDEFFAVLEERNLDVKKLDDNLVREIVEEIIENILEMSKYYIFSSTAKFKALTRKLKKVVFESIEYIVYTLKNSTFNILGHEIEFSDNGKYKPIIIELDSGKRVELVGKIDRLDIGKLDDKTYVRIIDYKSSIKNIDMNQVEAGLQIQLITYLDAITKQESFSPSGILYLGLTDNKVTNKRNLTEEEIKQEIRKKFRMNGIVLADVNIIKMMDTNINGASDIIPVTLKQDGNISESKSSTIDENEFEDLQKSVTNTIKQISTEILSGNIDIKPYNYKTQTGCDYCEYKSICMFNPNLKENTYNYIKKK